VLVTEGGAQTESWLNKRKKAGRTNKSMFTGESSKEHAEIDVNDPDFWKKVLPDLVTPDIMLERLSDDSLIDEEDESNREAVEKYMKDLAQMMEGACAVCAVL
jgi:flagellar motor protein MotB